MYRQLKVQVQWPSCFNSQHQLLSSNYKPQIILHVTTHVRFRLLIITLHYLTNIPRALTRLRLFPRSRTLRIASEPGRGRPPKLCACVLACVRAGPQEPTSAPPQYTKAIDDGWMSDEHDNTMRRSDSAMRRSDGTMRRNDGATRRGDDKFRGKIVSSLISYML